MKKPDKIEEVFQEAFKDYSVKPDSSVWTNIQSNIPTSGSSGFSAVAGNASIITKTVIGIAVVSGIGISAYFLSESYSTNEPSTPNPTQSEKVIPVDSEEKSNNNSISLDIQTDTVEHLSNQVEEKKIKEIEKVLVEPNKATAKTKTSTVTESNEKTVHTDKIKEIIEEKNETVNTEAKNTEALGGQSGQSVEQKNTATEVNSEDGNSGVSKSENVNQDQISPSNEPKDVISSEPKSEDFKIDATIPNIFTPNQDGHNDVFRISTKDAENLEATILDLNGKVLFEWKGLYGFWDGRLPNGELAPSGSYFYIVHLIKDGKTDTRKNIVTLKR